MAADTLRLFAMGARMNAISILRSRLSAAVNTSTDFIWHAGAMLAPVLVAVRFGHIGSWPAPAVVFMLGYGAVVESVLDAMGDNFWVISTRIGRGQLDHYLVQPQPLWRILLTEGFAPFSFWPVLTLGLITMAWSAHVLAVPVHAMWAAVLAINLVASMTVQTAFIYAWGSVAFWAPRSAEQISAAAGGLLNEVNFPLDSVPRALRIVLVTIIPSGLLSWLPTRSLLHIGGAAPLDVWLTPMAAIALGALALAIFRVGLHSYRQTGSRRYSDIGHRR
jgi:ABC-2 type transport system permease protein